MRDSAEELRIGELSLRIEKKAFARAQMLWILSDEIADTLILSVTRDEVAHVISVNKENSSLLLELCQSYQDWEPARKIAQQHFPVLRSRSPIKARMVVQELVAYWNAQKEISDKIIQPAEVFLRKWELQELIRQYHHDPEIRELVVKAYLSGVTIEEIAQLYLWQEAVKHKTSLEIVAAILRRSLSSDTRKEIRAKNRARAVRAGASKGVLSQRGRQWAKAKHEKYAFDRDFQIRLMKGRGVKPITPRELTFTMNLVASSDRPRNWAKIAKIVNDRFFKWKPVRTISSIQNTYRGNKSQKAS